MQVRVLGIGGVSNGGKTTLAKNLARALQKEGVVVDLIHQDDYFKDEEDVEFDEAGGFCKWDEIEAFDMKKMMKHVNERLERLSSINTGTYPVLIVEGILIFNYRDLNNLFAARYFFTLCKEEARTRRLNRTYIPPDTDNIFDLHVWPMYVKHHKELREIDLKMTEFDGSNPTEDTLAKVLSETLLLLPMKE